MPCLNNLKYRIALNIVIHIDDFCYQWRGKVVNQATNEVYHTLVPLCQPGTQQEHALLLLHGFASSPAVFRTLLPRLNQIDAFFCPVLPGHGESIEALAQTNIQAWIKAAEIACETLTQRYARVDVMGLSLGGLLASHLSQRFQLNHLYLLAPAFTLQGPLNATLWLTKALHRCGIKSIKNRGGDLCSPQNPELTYCRLPLSAIIEILTLIKQTVYIAPTCPTDLFLGRHDHVVNSLDIEQKMQTSANVTVHWLEHSAHVLPLDNDVNVIADVVNHAQALDNKDDPTRVNPRPSQKKP